MIKLTLNLAPYSKPRGQLGKHGNMTHSADAAYRDWQVAFRAKLKNLYPQPFPKFFCIVYIFYIATSKKGRSQDIDNMVGAVNDALTPVEGDKFGGWLKDDSWRYVPRIWTDTLPGIKSKIILCICQTPIEFLKLYIKLYIYKGVINIGNILEAIGKR